jgi:hypothetical protein
MVCRQLRCRTNLRATANETGKTGAGSARSPGLRAERSQNVVILWRGSRATGTWNNWSLLGRSRVACARRCAPPTYVRPEAELPEGCRTDAREKARITARVSPCRNRWNVVKAGGESLDLEGSAKADGRARRVLLQRHNMISVCTSTIWEIGVYRSTLSSSDASDTIMLYRALFS